jgi:hypothetical protein
MRERIMSFRGTILAMGAKGFHVLFDDGDQLVLQRPSVAPLHVEEGEQLFIRPKTDPRLIYFPARVLRVNGEIIDVEMEDGGREMNTRLGRARFWRCPVRLADWPFAEGDRVLAFHRDACLYPADIDSIQEDRVMVHYLSGHEAMLTPELIRRFELKAGDRIECRCKGGPHFFPGVIGEVEGERVFVRYDDGDEEWTSIRLLRRPASAL